MAERKVTHRETRVEYEYDPAVRRVETDPDPEVRRVVQEHEPEVIRTVRTEPVVVETTDPVQEELRERNLREVEAADREATRASVPGRIALAVDFVFFVIYALLGLRFVLTLLGARTDASFAQWVYSASDPLYAPFSGLLPNLTAGAGFTLALPVLFAILVYGLLHAAIRRLLRVFAVRRVVY